MKKFLILSLILLTACGAPQPPTIIIIEKGAPAPPPPAAPAVDPAPALLPVANPPPVNVMQDQPAPVVELPKPTEIPFQRDGVPAATGVVGDHNPGGNRTPRSP